jgi:hypothetical protein
LHPIFKNDITVDKYLELYELIKNYEEFINTFYKLLENDTNIPTDVIKYEIMKYI